MRRLIVVFLPVLLLAALASAQSPGIEPLLAPPDSGEPVRLVGGDIQVQSAGGQALTRIELVLHNPNARPMEGQLAFPLQPGQEVVGFALDIDGRMHDAVPVPKQRGREVFEAIERRNVDPALLERTEGNYFRLRVFPVPAGGERRVRLDLVQSLVRVEGARQLRLPLDFAAGLAAISLRVEGGQVATGPEGPVLADTVGGQSATLGAGQLRPGGSLVLRWPMSGRPQVVVQEHDGQRWFHVEVPLPDVSAARRLPGRIGLLWDASGSSVSRDQALEFELLDRYFAAVGDADVRLQVLRDRAGAIRRFEVRGGDWSALRTALQAEVPDGASNLGDWEVEADVQEYLLFGDGLANYGDRAFPVLSRGQRLYAVSSAGARTDTTRLGVLAEERGGRLVELLSAGELDRALSELLRDVPRLQGVSGSGVMDVVAASPFPRGGALALAGRLAPGPGELVLRIEEGGRMRRLRVPLGQEQVAPGRFLAQAWAGYRLRELQAEPMSNRDRIRQLGQDFGLATPETSLLVLETLDDYVRYDIEPPPALREEFLARRRDLAEERAGEARLHLARLVGAFEEKQAWWETDFREAGRKKGGVPVEGVASAAADAPPVVFDDPSPLDVEAAPPAPPAGFAEAAGESLDMIEVVGSHIAPEDLDGGGEAADAARTVIALQPWAPDSEVARRLRAAPADRLYEAYLHEREGHSGSSAFFVDVADLLLERGQRELALRVLSNLAEMQLENRALLRVLGYRLMQAGAPEHAVPVFRHVLEIAGEEPQSHRDFGLALDAAGRPQEAVEALMRVVERPWDARFGGIALIALAELNAIAHREGGRLDLDRLDPRLRRNLPLALRAVLSWDADNTDMDLWVVEPSGERCGYNHMNTSSGGRLSGDFTGGYGPEEYSIRRTDPGKYRIEVDYFGDSQVLVSGAVTVQVWLSAGFGTPAQRDQRLSVRLERDDDNVLVGEFEVR